LAGLAAAVVVAFAAGWLALGHDRGPAPPGLPTVAVLPFQIEVRGDTNDLASVLPQAFDWQLQYLPDHRVLGAEVRNEISERFGPTLPPPDSMLAAARRHGATLAVQGRVAPSGDDLTVSIIVQDVTSGRLVADADSTGPADSLDALVSGIVIEAFAARLAREVTGWSSSLPRGLDAINAYMHSDRDFRRGAYESAVERLDEVIRLDSTFAPAHFKRMLNLLLSLRPTQYSTHLWSALEAARRYREGLDPVSQQLLAGYELLLREGDVHGAEQALQDIVERYPRAIEAWYLLGYVQFNLRALLGTSLGEARRAFRRAVDRDPNFASALWHLALIAVLENDDDAARDYIARFLAVDSTSLQAQIAHTYDSLLYRGTGSFNRVLGSLDDRPTGVLEVMSLGTGELRPPPGVGPIAREALKAFWNRAGTGAERRIALRMRLAYLLGRGRLASADTLYREAEQTRVLRDELDRWALLTAVTAVPDLGDEAAQSAAASRLRNVEDDRGEALWLLARWHLARGDESAYGRALAQLASDTVVSTPLARSLAADIDAHRRLAAGDTASALAIWEEATQRHSVDQLMFGLTASLWPLQLDRAAVAQLAGQPEPVLRIAGGFDQMAGVIDQVAWPEILRMKAEAALAAGNLGLARRTYEELAGILEEANGTGTAMKEEAERALAELGGITGGQQTGR
jgi:tetratricopeptide (TPR) repeat protein